MRYRLPDRSAHAGFTLVEVLLALGLFSILVMALVQLLDTSLNIWEKTESEREAMEMGGAVMGLLASDVSGIDGSARGDLLCDWKRYDLDGDGIAGAVWPRLRLVRQASPAELARLAPGSLADPRARGLVEVCWALLPPREAEGDARPVGVLWRGQRAVSDNGSLSFFDPEFFKAGGRAVTGALSEVTGGILWFELLFASQTSVVHDGWKVGDQLADCGTSWDAWGKGRPALEESERNEAPAGMPQAKQLPLLPRRVAVRFELERPKELRLRTRLRTPVDEKANVLEVENGTRLPAVGRLILVGEEWMEITARSESSVTVKRGRRGSRRTNHVAGLLLHFGEPVVREVPVSMTREDWNL